MRSSVMTMRFVFFRWKCRRVEVVQAWLGQLGIVIHAFEKLASLPRADEAKAVRVTLGSATALPAVADKSVAAVVVDPPYDDNVQYSELADFFYVWLKRTQGHRHPDWFATYLCDHDEEAVVNLSRFRDGRQTVAAAREAARVITAS